MILPYQWQQHWPFPTINSLKSISLGKCSSFLRVINTLCLCSAGWNMTDHWQLLQSYGLVLSCCFNPSAARSQLAGLACLSSGCQDFHSSCCVLIEFHNVPMKPGLDWGCMVLFFCVDSNEMHLSLLTTFEVSHSLPVSGFKNCWFYLKLPQTNITSINIIISALHRYGYGF